MLDDSGPVVEAGHIVGWRVALLGESKSYAPIRGHENLRQGSAKPRCCFNRPSSSRLPGFGWGESNPSAFNETLVGNGAVLVKHVSDNSPFAVQFLVRDLYDRPLDPVFSLLVHDDAF
jgi:hypothetical protein